MIICPSISEILFLFKQCRWDLINNMPASFSTKGRPHFRHDEKPTFSKIIHVFTESIIFILSFKFYDINE